MPARSASRLTVRRLLPIAVLATAFAVAAPGTAGAQAPYDIPAGNPFVNTAGARPEVFVYGMRNPYRWSFDRTTGDMYIGDVGGINEEITFLARARQAGANLGWNCLSGTAVQNAVARRPPTRRRPSSGPAAPTWRSAATWFATRRSRRSGAAICTRASTADCICSARARRPPTRMSPR